MFELGRSLKAPIDLSIGQPHFAVPDPIKQAAKDAIDHNRNGYTVTQGIPELRGKIKSWLDRRHGQADRDVLITSGTSGALLLAMLATLNPGDEVIAFDPAFVAYRPMIELAGGVPVWIDTYPSFQLDVDQVKAAITPRTKMILFNSPANPAGAVASRAAVRDLAQLAGHHGILLISDEIYRVFSYDGPLPSPAEFNEDTLVVDGFGKAYGFTGWRLGFAHGPKSLIEQMAKLQQFTFVCAPSIVQYAGLAAWDLDVTPYVADYRRKRDRLSAALHGHFEFVIPGGAFYLFAKTPWGTGTEFVTAAIDQNLLLIPGAIFSHRDTHFRVSYAAEDATLSQGIDILIRLAKR